MPIGLDFAGLGHSIRFSLLEGSTIVLVIRHEGTQPDYLHQLSAARGPVAPDRYRQLTEQAESPDLPVSVEFPIRALRAASPEFNDMLESDGHGNLDQWWAQWDAAAAQQNVRDTDNTTTPVPDKIYLNMRSLLPGFAMEVLDWLASALRAREWFDFVPEHPSIDEADKFFWLYPYLTMRILGMNSFAEKMVPLFQTLIDHHQLADDAWTAELILKHTQASDPLLIPFAERDARLILRNEFSLSTLECTEINTKFPEFGALVSACTQKISADCMPTQEEPSNQDSDGSADMEFSSSDEESTYTPLICSFDNMEI